MTTQDLINTLKQGKPMTDKLMREIVRELEGKVALVSALTPSAETKAAYMGEFSIKLPEFDKNGGEYLRPTNVPWITIKEIMKAISSRASLAKLEAHDGR